MRTLRYRGKIFCNFSGLMTMRASLARIMLLAFSVASSAAEVRRGATMEVKPNSIWFSELSEFTHWQRLKKSGNAEAVAAYQKDMLSSREA